MESSFSNSEIENIIKIEGNDKCNDCKAKNPHWVSINNAVLLCSTCARVHQTFNDDNISMIKSIEVDSFSKEEIEIMKLGGNAKFTSLMDEYKITSDIENYNELKYYLVITEYYRKMLKLQSIKDENLIYLKEYKEHLLNTPLIEEGIMLVNINESAITKALTNVFNKINSGIEVIGEVIANKAHQLGIDAKIKEVSTILSNKINNIGNTTNSNQEQIQPQQNEISSQEELNENNTIVAKTNKTKEELSQLLNNVINEYKVIKEKRSKEEK